MSWTCLRARLWLSQVGGWAKNMRRQQAACRCCPPCSTPGKVDPAQPASVSSSDSLWNPVPALQCVRRFAQRKAWQGFGQARHGRVERGERAGIKPTVCVVHGEASSGFEPLSALNSNPRLLRTARPPRSSNIWQWRPLRNPSHTASVFRRARSRFDRGQCLAPPTGLTNPLGTRAGCISSGPGGRACRRYSDYGIGVYFSQHVNLTSHTLDIYKRMRLYLCGLHISSII
jgi:hypothetical protein